MQRITKGLFLLEAGGFVNAYLVEGPRGLTLVDTAHPRSAERLALEIESGGFALKDIEQIVLTHSHADHAGGAAYLLERHRVRVFAHPQDAPAILGRARLRPLSVLRWVRALLQRLWFPYRPLEVVVPVEPGETLRALPHWQILHTPGHTPGSLSLFKPTERVLICGDALSNRNDSLNLSPAAYNDDAALAAQSARRLAGLDCDVLCCGHGPVIRACAGRRLQELIERLT